MTTAKIVLPIKDLTLLQLHDTLVTICDWEEQSYGEGLHRTPNQLASWLWVNDYGFLCCFIDDKLTAYADVWSMYPDFFNSLKLGHTAEEEISKEALCSYGDIQPYLYVGSIITDPVQRIGNPMVTKTAFKTICGALADTIDDYCRKTKYPVELLGVGSSDTGKKLLDYWGFSPIVMASDACDIRPRYVKMLTSKQDTSIFRFKNHG